MEINPIEEKHLEEVAKFLTVQTAGQKRLQSSLPPLGRRIRWLLLENPAYQPCLPLGWTLRNIDSRIVGAMLCAPQGFCWQQQTYTFLMSSWYHVDSSCRGLGSFLFFRYLQLGKRYVLFVTSANSQAGALWKRFGGHIVHHTSHELVGIIRWEPVLQEMIGRKFAAKKLTSITLKGMAPYLSVLSPWHTRHRYGELIPLASLEDVTRLNLAPPSHKVAALHDPSFIRWRYFSSPDPTVALFSFRLKDGNRDYVVAVNQTQRGTQIPIRALNVLDFPWDLPPDSLPLLSALLADRYKEESDVLVFRCLTSGQQQTLRQAGFWQRELKTPPALYVDQGNLLLETDWRLTPADGDTLI